MNMYTTRGEPGGQALAKLQVQGHDVTQGGRLAPGLCWPGNIELSVHRETVSEK